MSTEMGKIKGLVEDMRPGVGASTHISTELYMISFFGGVKRGTCLQLTPTNDHIQLTRDHVEELRDILNTWLTNTKGKA